MIDFSQILHHVKRFIQATGELVDRIPKEDDDKFTVALKVVSLADSGHEYFFGKPDPIKNFMSQLNVKEKVSKAFVHLFFKSLVRDEFNIRQIPIKQAETNYIIVHASIPGNGELYLIRWNSNEEEASDCLDVFYHTPDFDFETLLMTLWDDYDGRIYVSPDTEEASWKRLTAFSSFPKPEGPIFGHSQMKLERLCAKNLQFRKDSRSRSYMFVGEPGTGKSTLAVFMASGSNKIIKMDSKCLESITVDSIDFLLTNLKPDFVIIDDIDKILFGNGIPTLLYTLEMIKLVHPKTSVIVTANEIDKLDPAILRPGRLDEVVIFECDDEDRDQIIRGYLDQYNKELSDEDITKIVTCTSGLTGAYIKEFVLQLCYIPLEEVLDDFNKRKRLMGLGKNSSEDEDDELAPDVDGAFMNELISNTKGRAMMRTLINRGSTKMMATKMHPTER